MFSQSPCVTRHNPRKDTGLSGSFSDQKKPFTAQDIRFIIKGNVLYAIALGQPSDNTSVKVLGMRSGNGTITGIELVGNSVKPSWSQQADALGIKPSKNYPSENSVVYKISFKKKET